MMESINIFRIHFVLIAKKIIQEIRAENMYRF